MAFITERISKEDVEKYSLLGTINKIRKNMMMTKLVYGF